jgi:hypothetical protein
MGWERRGDGLKLVGVHFNAANVEDAIERLSFARNRPAEMCRLLRESIRNGFFSKDTIMRFSKWCNWDDASETDAQTAIRELFGEVVPRMRDQGNKPYPNAIVIYQDFLKSVVARYSTPTR